MPRPFHLALVTLGLAAAVYGTASMTGGWLGTPPWWEKTETQHGHTRVKGLSTMVMILKPSEWTSDRVVLREERFFASSAVLAIGAALATSGAWPRRRRPTETTYAPRHPRPRARRYDRPVRPVVRIALVVVGLGAAVYGLANLTGGWLGTPPWWEREQTAMVVDRVVEVDEASWSGRPRPLPRHWTLRRYRQPVSGHEWISGGVVATGLVVAALGAWPRRRRRPVTT